MEAERSEDLDLRSKVLQHALAGVSSTQGAGTGAGAGAAGDAHERCCVICLEAISEACEAQPCRHANFDYLCLLSWLEQQARCPLCKAEVGEVRYGLDDGGGGPASSSSSSPPTWKTYKVPAPRTEVPRRPRPPVRDGPYYTAPPPRSHREAARVRSEAEREAEARRREERALRVRRDVYRHQLYSLHMGSNRYSQYRDLTPQLFERDAGLVSRARGWLRRELAVFAFLRPPPAPTTEPSSSSSSSQAGGGGGGSDAATTTRRRANNAEFLLEYIVAILKTVDVQGSKGQAEDMLQEFLGRDNARLLLHELRSFLRSPHSIEAWDRHVQYPNPRKRRRSERGDDDDDDDGGGGGDDEAERRGPDGAATDQPRAGGSVQAARGRGDFYRPRY